MKWLQREIAMFDSSEHFRQVRAAASGIHAKVRAGVIHVQTPPEVTAEQSDFKVGDYEAARVCTVIAARRDSAIMKP
jgi:hypothetical protein